MAARPKNNLERLLTDAARQALYMRGARNDALNKDRGLKFLYGADSNVVLGWGNPHGQDNDGKRKRNKLGRIFSHDSDALATGISWDLLSFIFGGTLGPPDMPLILVPPMHKEVAGILDNLYKRAEETGNTGDDSGDLRKRIEEITQSDTFLQDPEESMPEILGIFEQFTTKFGPRFTLRRIALLLTRSKIAPLFDVQRKLTAEVRSVLLPTKEQIDLHHYRLGGAVSGRGSGHDKTPGWRDRLKAVGTWKHDDLLEHDAWVLSRIQIWNEDFIEREIDWRFLYITADNRLFRAAAQVFPKPGNPLSFADMYLRHPHAFLSEKGVLGQIQRENATKNEDDTVTIHEGVGDWLSLLTEPAQVSMQQITGTAADQTPIPDTIRKLAEKIAVRQSGTIVGKLAAARDIEDKWTSFANGATVFEYADDDRLEGLKGGGLAQLAREFQGYLQDHEDDLEALRKISLSEYLRATTRLSRSVESVSDLDGKFYEPAPIFYEGWLSAATAIVLMHQWPAEGVGDNDYQKAIDLIENDDDTNYAFYLAHAFYFASRGRWTSALLVVRRARKIGQDHTTDDGFKDTTDGAHGREAAYFEASCMRHKAQGEHDLEYARLCLADATDILDKEIAIGRFTEFLDERFKLEAVEIDHCELKIRALSGSKLDARAIESLAEGYLAVNAAVKTRYLDSEQSGTGNTHGRFARIAQLLERQTLVAILSISFLEAARDNRIIRGYADKVLDELQDHLQTLGFDDTRFCKFERLIFLAAQYRQNPRHAAKPLRRSLRNLLDELKGSKGIHNYDKPVLDEIALLL
jgi:hypothetical protein